MGDKDDTFDEAPDTVAEKDEIGEGGQEAENGRENRDKHRDSGQSSAEDGKEEATTEEAEMDHAFLAIAEVPVVGAEATEEDAEEAGGDGGFRGDVARLVWGGWVS